MQAPSVAESLYCRFLLGDTPATGLEQLCALHPDLAAELRACDDRHRLATSMLQQDQSTADPSFAQRYTTIAEIGRGGMGAVFEVEDRRLGRRVALKLALPGRADGLLALVRRERARAGIAREARLLAQLAHPGIVPVHDVGVDAGGNPYFSMKLVRGQSLLDLIGRNHRGDCDWPLVRLVTVLHKVALTLAATHRGGIVHRDIKPENIMVGDEGQVYVLDWGIAELEHPERERAAGVPIAGTPAYMAPEQAAGSQNARQPAVDVHGLGAVLYHLLAGHRPYAELTAAGPQTQLAEVRRRPPRPLVALVPRAPTALVAIADKAMAAMPADRYPDIAAMAADLRAFLELRPVTAEPRRALDGLRWWARRNAGTATMLALAAAVLVLASVSWAVIQSSTADELQASARRQEQATAAALEQEALAVARARRLLLPADRRRLEDLLQEQDWLGPAVPANVAKINAWLARAEALLARRSEHEQALADVRARAAGADPELAVRIARLDAEVAHAVAVRDAAFLALARTPADTTCQTAAVHASELLAQARADRTAAPTWQFANPDDRWLHDALAALLDRLGDLPPRLTLERPRLAHALSIEDRSRTSADARAAWSDASAAIAGLPCYRGLRLPPQLGLLPLGPDRDSGLWEFAHLQSGRPAIRDVVTGQLTIAEDTGIVLVLIPGASASDARPSFVSKYEMTQAQWLRATGSNPSILSPDNPELRQPVSLLHPVGSLSLPAVRPVLDRLDLEVPDDALWLHAARARSTSRWIFGDSPDSVRGYANCADLATLRAWVSPVLVHADYDDGFATTSPVGALRANAFGLHDVLGNATELTLGDDPTKERLRGGGALYGAPDMPGDWRQDQPSANAWLTYGIRPARRLDD